MTEGQRGNAVKSKYSFESPGIFKPFMCRSVVNGFFAATAAAAGGRWAKDGVTERTRKNNYDQPNGHINMDTGRGRPGL